MSANWENDEIQFPRLLAEIIATQDIDMQALAESMDLEINEVDSLFERAQAVWDNIRATTTPATEIPHVASIPQAELDAARAEWADASDDDIASEFILFAQDPQTRSEELSDADMVALLERYDPDRDYDTLSGGELLELMKHYARE